LFGIAASLSIALLEVIETKNPSLDTVYCFSALISPLPVFLWKKCRKPGFRRGVLAKATMTERSFGDAVSLNMVLDAMLEEYKQLYEPSLWVSHSQSPLPVDGKVLRKAAILSGKRRKRPWRMDQMKSRQVDRLYLM